MSNQYDDIPKIVDLIKEKAETHAWCKDII